MPIEWGLRRRLSTVRKTGFYDEASTMSLKPYRNAMILQLVYRFNSGKTKRASKRGSIEGEKRVEGGMRL